MGRRADRQELSQAFDDAKQDGDEIIIHDFMEASASSASTISRTSSTKEPVGCQPKVALIFSAEPTRCAGSLSRSNARLCLTYFSHGNLTTAKAASTNSRTECVSPVATT